MQDIPESIFAAEGARDAEQGGKFAGNKNCLNCGNELKGLYCHVCGQKDLPQRQTTRELLSNFISSFSNFEGKFFQTAKQLILRPGFLALEYNTGKRERYFHPVRMYAFISFVFFLIFFSLPEKKDDKTELDDEDLKELAEDSIALDKDIDRRINRQMAAFGVDTTELDLDSMVRSQRDSIKKERKKSNFNFGLSKTEYSTVRAYDSAQAAAPENKRHNWFIQKLTRRSIELNAKYSDKPGEFGKDFWKASLDSFSTLLFFLLPVFALLLKLLYVRRNYFYSEHLVFSIYYYNFFYFAGSIMMLVGLVDALGWLVALIGWGIYVYLLFSMKRMYKQGWGKTIAKFLILSFLFWFCFLIAYLINAFTIMMIL